MDRTAGRWVRNRAVATSDGWTDNKIRYGQGGRKGGGGEKGGEQQQAAGLAGTSSGKIWRHVKGLPRKTEL